MRSHLFVLVATLFVFFSLRSLVTPSVGYTAAPSVSRVYLPIVFTAPRNTPTPTPLPSPLPTNTPSPTNTPGPSSPQIAHTTLYSDLANYTHILGEVINYSGSPIFDAVVTVTYYNANGSVAGSHDTYAYASMIQPGERSPFDNLSQPQTGWARYVLSLSYSTSSYTTYSHAFFLSGQNQWSDSSYEYYAGTITNTSGQAQQFPKVILTGYDASGNVVVADFTYANGLTNYTINPNQSASYQDSVTLDQASGVSSMTFLVEGSQ